MASGLANSGVERGGPSSASFCFMHSGYLVRIDFGAMLNSHAGAMGPPAAMPKGSLLFLGAKMTNRSYEDCKGPSVEDQRAAYRRMHERSVEQAKVTKRAAEKLRVPGDAYVPQSPQSGGSRGGRGSYGF